METGEQMDIIIKALLALVPLVVTVLSYYLRGWIKTLDEKARTEIGNEQYALLLTFAGIFIRSVEQTLGYDAPGAKKEAVVGMLLELANNNGIVISREQIEALIEGVYNEIKEEL